MQAPVEDAIVWEAPARCPGPAVVRATVARLLRASTGRPSFRAAARVEEEGEELTVKLSVTVGEGTGERVLRGGSCEALADATATIIALAVDPDGVARLPAGPAATVAPLVLVPASPPPPAPSVEAPAPPVPLPVETVSRAMVGPYLGVEIGLLPSVLPTLGAFGSVRRGPLGFVLWGATGTGQRVVAPSGAGAEVSAAAIGAGACRGLLALPVGPCLGLSAARVAGGGFGAGIAPRANSKVLVRAEIGAEGVVERGFWGARIAAFVIAPLQRQSFVVGEGEELFRPSVVGGRAELTAFVQF